jgi:hypothetical protein
MKETVDYREKPFEYLRPNSADDEVVKNWYLARAFVLDKLGEQSFAPGEEGHLHVLIDGDSPIMLAILRQVALTTHYPNYVEYDELDNLVCRNRTLITLVSKQDSQKDILSELKKEVCLCNLLDLCKYSVYGVVTNKDSFVDIEIEIVEKASEDAGCIRISETDVFNYITGKKQEEIYSIDTQKAFYASKAYDLGSVIESIPYEDINDAGRFNEALDTFQYKVLRDKGKNIVNKDKWSKSLLAVKLGLSNIICADSFESRELAIKKQCPDYDKLDYNQKHALWEKDAHALSLCEHGRWVVEKLILGFSPLNPEQRNEYERLFGDRRKAYAKKLKNDASSPAHLDLCSYRDLRRVDPDNLKYDSFLMLAIPLILEAIRK